MVEPGLESRQAGGTSSSLWHVPSPLGPGVPTPSEMKAVDFVQESGGSSFKSHRLNPVWPQLFDQMCTKFEKEIWGHLGEQSFPQVLTPDNSPLPLAKWDFLLPRPGHGPVTYRAQKSAGKVGQ